MSVPGSSRWCKKTAGEAKPLRRFFCTSNDNARYIRITQSPPQVSDDFFSMKFHLGADQALHVMLKVLYVPVFYALYV